MSSFAAQRHRMLGAVHRVANDHVSRNSNEDMHCVRPREITGELQLEIGECLLCGQGVSHARIPADPRVGRCVMRFLETVMFHVKHAGGVDQQAETSPTKGAYAADKTLLEDGTN